MKVARRRGAPAERKAGVARGVRSMSAAWACCPSTGTAISSSCASFATRSTRKRSKCRPERWITARKTPRNAACANLRRRPAARPAASCRSARCILTRLSDRGDVPVRGARPDRGRDASGRGRIRRDRPPADRGGGAADRGGQDCATQRPSRRCTSARLKNLF